MIRMGPGGDGQEDFPSWALSGVLGGLMGKQFVGGKHYPDLAYLTSISHMNLGKTIPLGHLYFVARRNHKFLVNIEA